MNLQITEDICSADPTPRIESRVPAVFVDAVIESLDRTHSAFFSDRPSLTELPDFLQTMPCVAGIISFVGEVNWTLTWILAQDSAPNLARRFAGFDVPFDSADMGDLAGELVNVLAGDIVDQLGKRHIKASMSLPTVTRGHPLQLLTASSHAVVCMECVAPEGVFWFRLAAGKKLILCDDE